CAPPSPRCPDRASTRDRAQPPGPASILLLLLRAVVRHGDFRAARRAVAGAIAAGVAERVEASGAKTVPLRAQLAAQSGGADRKPGDVVRSTGFVARELTHRIRP